MVDTEVPGDLLSRGWDLLHSSKRTLKACPKKLRGELRGGKGGGSGSGSGSGGSGSGGLAAARAKAGGSGGGSSSGSGSGKGEVEVEVKGESESESESSSGGSGSSESESESEGEGGSEGEGKGESEGRAAGSSAAKARTQAVGGGGGDDSQDEGAELLLGRGRSLLQTAKEVKRAHKPPRKRKAPAASMKGAAMEEEAARGGAAADVEAAKRRRIVPPPGGVYERDLATGRPILALDCEFVGVRRRPAHQAKHQAEGGAAAGEQERDSLAQVCVVDHHGDTVYSSYCRPDEADAVVDYRTRWSGIRPQMLVGVPPQPYPNPSPTLARVRMRTCPRCPPHSLPGTLSWHAFLTLFLNARCSRHSFLTALFP